MITQPLTDPILTHPILDILNQACPKAIVLHFEDDLYKNNASHSGIHHHFKDHQHCLTVDPSLLHGPLVLIHRFKQHRSKENPFKKNISILQGPAIFLIELYLDHEHSIASQNSNSICTDIHLKRQSTCQHIQCFIGNNTSNQHLNTQVQPQSHSHYQGTLLFFNHLVHTIDFSLNFKEPNAKAKVHTLLFPKKHQKNTISLVAHHEQPHCESEMIARGVIHDEAKGALVGKIVVDKNADKTRARLENKNLLLSLSSEMFSQPILEVNTDDVECTHGATVGHLDDHALFYLKSRGIPEHQAKKMLIRGFIEPVFKQIPDCLHTLLEHCIDEH